MKSFLRQMLHISSRSYTGPGYDDKVLTILDLHTVVDYARKAIKFFRMFKKTVALVPQDEAHVIERLGKYHRILEPGYNTLYTAFDTVAYRHRLKELAVKTSSEPAVTKDGAKILIDGIVWIKITDPKLASYAVDEPVEAVALLAHSLMRTEIAKMTLDMVKVEERELSDMISTSVRAVVKDWGVACTRYYIREVSTSDDVMDAMKMEAQAKIVKPSRIIDASANKDSAIIKANEEKEAAFLIAHGEAVANTILSRAKAKELSIYAENLKNDDGVEAASLMIAMDHIDALAKMAKPGTLSMFETGYREKNEMKKSGDCSGEEKEQEIGGGEHDEEKKRRKD